MKQKALRHSIWVILLILTGIAPSSRGETFPDFFNSRFEQTRFFNGPRFCNRGRCFNQNNFSNNDIFLGRSSGFNNFNNQGRFSSQNDFSNDDIFLGQSSGFNNFSNQGRFSNQNNFSNESLLLGRFSEFNNFNNSRDLIIQRGNFEFFGDAQQIAGFSRILKRGNQLIGQTIDGNQLSLFIDGRGNLVDRTGRRVANRDPEIVRQAQSFFLQNRQNFQGGQRNAIDRFLFASGGFGRGGRVGRMTIDLAAFSLKENGDGKDLPKGTTRVQAGLAALNFFLNTIQNRCLIRIFENQIDQASGTVSVDFTTFRDGNGNLCFSGETLALMEASDTKAVCNNGKIRINELINNMLQPVNYNVAQGIAGLNRTQISQAFGVSENKLDTFGNKILVGSSQDGRKQSGVVGGPQRVLERQFTRNIPGRFCYRSYDFKDVHEGGAGSLARSVEESGILFSHEAEEWLCVGANGFLMTFLFNANGDLLDEAPGSIASNPGLLSPAVRNPASCLDCHRQGFLGGKPGRYDEQKQKIRVSNVPIAGRADSSGRQLTHGDYFTSNAQYNGVAQQDGNLFVEAQKRSGSFLWDPEKNDTVALLPSSMDAYNAEVNVRRMARELGVTEEVAKRLLGDRKGIKRIEFDANFCQYKQAAGNTTESIGAEKSPGKKTGTNTQTQDNPVNHNSRPSAVR